MRTKLTRVGILVAALLGLLATSIPSAHATTIATATFVGTASVTGGLGYPCAPIPPGPDVPNCVVDATAPKTGNTGAFGFSSLVCVGEKVDIAKEPKGTGVYGPECSIQAAGVVTGYCGLSLGAGAGTVTWFPVETKTVQFTFKFTSAGGTLVVTGSTNKGEITAVVEAVPDPTAGSCLSKTATGFLIAGQAAIVNPTPGPIV